MLVKPVYISGIASISPLGISNEGIWKNYLKNIHFFTKREGAFVAELPQTAKKEIEQLKTSDNKYKSLDYSTLFAIYSARKAIENAGWKARDNFGINIGSSRGATELFETYYDDFLNRNKAETLSSPTTTLGNISSWVAHDLQTKGPEISHSITCSTALHAVLNGVAWLQSGLCDKFLVGGSEAPLTAFTIAQMQALKIYSRENPNLRVSKHSEQLENKYPCLALDLKKDQNSMILGEGAAMICLDSKDSKEAIAQIIGVGYATEILEHNVSLSTNGMCFQRSMVMALGNLDPNEVDVIVTHTPGTIKGDSSEIEAIKKVFNENTPALTTNKWKIGHTLGASGVLSIELAILMLQKQEFISVPYIQNEMPKRIKNIMVNAVGFGGNAVSILLSK